MSDTTMSSFAQTDGVLTTMQFLRNSQPNGSGRFVDVTVVPMDRADPRRQTVIVRGGRIATTGAASNPRLVLARTSGRLLPRCPLLQFFSPVDVDDDA